MPYGWGFGVLGLGFLLQGYPTVAIGLDAKGSRVFGRSS